MASTISAGVRKGKQLLIPDGLILGVAGGLLLAESVQPTIAALARAFAVTALVGGILLAWRFHRTRVLFATIALALATAAVERVVSNSALSSEVTVVVFNAIALLLPLNLLGITLLGERGLMTPWGLARLAVPLLQVGLVTWLVYPNLSPKAVWLAVEFYPTYLSSWSPLPQLALVAYAAAAVWMVTYVLLRPSSTARGFFWSLVASFLAMHTAADVVSATIYLGTAGLILVVGIIEATYFMAFRDPLTELPARRAFNSALLQLRSQYSVAMVDIDRFKKFNDQHGHDVGDQVLKMVATQLGEVTGGGKAYRYGGEEFAILFPGKTRDDCEPHLEATRQAVEEETFTVRSRRRPYKRPAKPKTSRRPGKHLSVTISIGVAERNGRYTTPEKVVKAADRALYRAKDGGRNQVSR